nr:hypothetical protein [Bacilli bacterium]
VAVAAGFFAGMSRYSLLDSFGNGNSPVFWGGYASTRFSLLILVAACLVNAKSDYDPNPIQLDEFGNPIDTVK